MQNGANANGRYYPKGLWLKNLNNVKLGYNATPHVPEIKLDASVEWIHYESESKSLSVSERQELFASAWDWGVKAHTDRAAPEENVTRIAVATTGLRGIVQGRRIYYNLEDFKKLYNHVTRNRQCGTGLMRKGAICGKDV